MVLLGANTKSVKSYGKRKTHVTNTSSNRGGAGGSRGRLGVIDWDSLGLDRAPRARELSLDQSSSSASSVTSGLDVTAGTEGDNSEEEQCSFIVEDGDEDSSSIEEEDSGSDYEVQQPHSRFIPATGNLNIVRPIRINAKMKRKEQLEKLKMKRTELRRKRAQTKEERECVERSSNKENLTKQDKLSNNKINKIMKAPKLSTGNPRRFGRPASTQSIVPLDLPAMEFLTLSSDEEDRGIPKGRGERIPESRKIGAAPIECVTLTDDETNEEDGVTSQYTRKSSRFQDLESNMGMLSIASTSPSQTRSSSPSLPTTVFPEAVDHSLKSLLTLCSQSCPFAFSKFVEDPPFAAFSDSTQGAHSQSPGIPATRSSSENVTTKSWRKVGEASYSEVYGFTMNRSNSEKVVEKDDELVIKIIPIVENASEPSFTAQSINNKSAIKELPPTSTLQSIIREIKLSKLLSGEPSSQTNGNRPNGFVHFRGAFVVKGIYPNVLLKEWDKFKRSQKPSCEDQIKPDVFCRDQLFAVIVLEHAGSDLETFKLESWQEATSVFEQVVNIVAYGEKANQFEHRDLHWGNILIRSSPKTSEGMLPESDHSSNAPLNHRSKATPRQWKRNSISKPHDIKPSAYSPPCLQVTLIDFTLSRASIEVQGKKCVLFDSLDDDCLFSGEGDHQYDIYRQMREIVLNERETGEGWQGFHPFTNLLWLHYLSRKLLTGKGLKKPSSTTTTTTVRPQSGSKITSATVIIRRGRKASGPMSSLHPPSTTSRKVSATTSAITTKKTQLAEQNKHAHDKRAYEFLVTAEKLLGRRIQAMLEQKQAAKMVATGARISKVKNGGPQSRNWESEDWESAGDVQDWIKKTCA